LLEKDSFQWTNITNVAFIQLKEVMTKAPVLAIPNFKEPFLLETDASGSGIGVVLSQGKHPIACFSKKLTPRMQKQSTYVREFYAITKALAKFRHYLLGNKFVIKTDQKSLKEILEQNLHTLEQQQCLPKFLGYDFTIQYKPGKENIPADGLSRSLMVAWSQPNCQWIANVAALTEQDPELLPIVQQCMTHKSSRTDYALKNGVLFWKHRMLIPNNYDLVTQILEELHCSKIGGHAGCTKTTTRICS